jgi:hypothetical protein
MWKPLVEAVSLTLALSCFGVCLCFQFRHVSTMLDLSSEEFKRAPLHIRVVGKGIAFVLTVLGVGGSP